MRDGSAPRLPVLRARSAGARPAVGEIVEQNLDRDGAVESSIARLIDLAHPATANEGTNLVVAQAGTGGQGQGW